MLSHALLGSPHPLTGVTHRCFMARAPGFEALSHHGFPEPQRLTAMRLSACCNRLQHRRYRCFSAVNRHSALHHAERVRKTPRISLRLAHNSSTNSRKADNYTEKGDAPINMNSSSWVVYLVTRCTEMDATRDPTSKSARYSAAALARGRRCTYPSRTT